MNPLPGIAGAGANVAMGAQGAANNNNNSYDRQVYNALITAAKANPTQFSYNQLASLIGNNLGHAISPQEYLGALGQIYPHGGTSGGTVPGANTTAGGQTGGGTTLGYNDPGTLALYGQSIDNINKAMGLQGGQLQQAQGTINANTLNALNQLLLGRNQGEQSYHSNQLQQQQNDVQAKSQIGANAGLSLNGLQRLLGSRGAGGSSSYSMLAPEAVANQASQQFGQTQQQFGQNMQGLDTNWGNYLTGYNNQVSGVQDQQQQQLQGAQNTVDQNKASLLQQLATLTTERAGAQGNANPGASAQPYLDQANGLLAGLSNYTPSAINYQTNAYQAPSLSSYTVNPNASPTFNGQPAGNDYFTPYLQALMGKKQPGVG